MRSVPIRVPLVPFVGWIIGAALMSCVAFDSTVQSTVEDLNIFCPELFLFLVVLSNEKHISWTFQKT